MSWDSFEKDALKHGSHSRYGCKIGKVLEKVDEKSANAIRAALANEMLSGNSLAKAFREREPEMMISPEGVLRHRRGECSCGGTS